MVKYHGLARRYLLPSGFLMRPLLNGGTLGRLGNVIDAATTNLSPELSDRDWFNSFCELLARDRRPTLEYVVNILGTPKDDPPRERRGSLFLAPFDPRFSYVSVNPDSPDPSAALPLEHVGLTGPTFSLVLSDVMQRFPKHRVTPNTYDGGSQVFFYPVPEEYEFSALATSTDLEDIPDARNLVVNNISFQFGTRLVEYRDGFAMRR